MRRWRAQGTRARGGGAGAVALVLGAGNQAAVAPLDVLHKLVAEDSVVICKMNPVNEYVGPFLRWRLSLQQAAHSSTRARVHACKGSTGGTCRGYMHTGGAVAFSSGVSDCKGTSGQGKNRTVLRIVFGARFIPRSGPQIEITG